MLGAALITVLGLTFWGVKYSYEPPPEKVLSRTRPSPEAYDLLGTHLQRAAGIFTAPD